MGGEAGAVDVGGKGGKKGTENTRVLGTGAAPELQRPARPDGRQVVARVFVLAAARKSRWGNKRAELYQGVT